MKQAPQPLLTAEEMAAVDRYTIETLGIGGPVLMEQAGRAVAEACRALLGDRHRARIAVICGRGNNGGDGLVAARWLTKWYPHVDVFLLGEPDKVKGDARLQLDIWTSLGHAVRPVDDSTLGELAHADLIVDAMLGTGARGELRDWFRKAARAINEAPCPVVAVDIPTGVDAGTAACDPHAVRATVTVTFGSLKIGHVFSPGHDHCGRIELVDIGFPAEAFEHIAPKTFLLDRRLARSLMPCRERTVFKNRCGQIYVLAGSMGMGGAAYLASRAALRVGAGLVILGTPASLAQQFEGRLIEVIKEPLPETSGHLADGALELVSRRLSWAHVMAVGPGLGTAEETGRVVEAILGAYEGILVLDADGINVLAGKIELLHHAPARIILTPHPGEFSRLTGVQKEAVEREPVRWAREYATQLGVYILLKGAPSVAATPTGEVYVNSVGNPGMATAGMGDVLTGTIAGLAGQLRDAEAAMMLGMYLHSLAGDLASQKFGQLPLTAGDVLETLPHALQSLESDDRPA